MPITYNCPNCGRQSSAPDHFAGQGIACPSCGSRVTVPGRLPGRSSSSGGGGGGGGGGLIVGIILAVIALGVLGCAGVAAAVLLPAWNQGMQARDRMEGMNNAKQIILAIHNYHDTYGKLPPAVVVDAEGKPLYSGRVLLLPFLGYDGVYQSWNKDKAWDSPENQALSSQAIPVFQNPAGMKKMPNRTDYLFLTGPGTAMEGARSTSFADLLDGTSNTVCLIDMKDTGVAWSEPRELDIDQLSSGLPDGNHRGGHLLGLYDGSVRFVLKQDLTPERIRSLATRNGGEPSDSF